MNRYWRVYLKHLTEDKANSLIGMVLEAFDDKQGRQSRLFGFSPVFRERNPQEHIERLNFEIDNIIKKKGMVMEDFQVSVEIDELIHRLNSYVKKIADYDSVLENSRFLKIAERDTTTQREKDLFMLGMVLLESARYEDVELADEYIDAGFPMNFQHPTKGVTALHVAANADASSLIKTLVESGKCDYLIPDNSDHLAYDIVYRYGHNRDISDLVKQKTEEQAERDGVELTFKYPAPT